MRTINLFKGLLASLMLMISANVSASSSYQNAYDFKKDGIYYNITDVTKMEVEVTYQKAIYDDYCGVILGRESDYKGDIKIPSSVTYLNNTYSVTSIGNYAFNDCDGLTSVTIPNSVTSIGNEAFFHCI